MSFFLVEKLSITVQKFSKCRQNGNDRLRQGNLRRRLPAKALTHAFFQKSGDFRLRKLFAAKSLFGQSICVIY